MRPYTFDGLLLYVEDLEGRVDAFSKVINHLEFALEARVKEFLTQELIDRVTGNLESEFVRQDEAIETLEKLIKKQNKKKVVKRGSRKHSKKK